MNHLLTVSSIQKCEPCYDDSRKILIHVIVAVSRDLMMTAVSSIAKCERFHNSSNRMSTYVNSIGKLSMATSVNSTGKYGPFHENKIMLLA